MATLFEYLDPYKSDLAADVGTTPLPGVRIYLGAAASEDPILLAWFSTAIEWCDQKLSSVDFTEPDGTSAQPPDACVLGVYEFVRVLRDYASRGSVVARKVKTGAREEEYDVAGMAGRLNAAMIAAWPYLEPYVQDPSLFASGGA